MYKTSLIAAGAALLCSAGFAQNQIDPGKMYPITSTPKNAGVYDWGAKKWVGNDRAVSLRANSLSVYDNTCTWTGGGFFTSVESCEALYDEGQIPSDSNPTVAANGLTGVTNDNLINFFQIGYCTSVGGGVVDMQFGFFELLAGFCNGGITPTGAGQPAISGQATAYFDLSGAGLPGSSMVGAVACWLVGFGNFGFCMSSDGNGVWDNALASDLFTWTFEHNMAGAAAHGLIINGEPSTVPVHACTYNIACASDALYGNPCGSGYPADATNNTDGWFLNVDGDMGGDTLNTSTVCSTAGSNGAGAGSNCYWFGGWPGNPYGSFWMVLGSAGECAGCTGSLTNYCTAGLTSGGCTGSMTGTGVPSPRNLAPFTLAATGIDAQRQGIVFYGINGRSASVWGMAGMASSSFLCVKSPTQRTGAQNSGGTVGTCTGTLSVDFNGYIAANPTALGNPFSAGAVVNAQGWFRDPMSPNTTHLSDGLEFTMCP